MSLKNLAILVIFLAALTIAFFYLKELFLRPPKVEVADVAVKMRKASEAKVIGWTAYWDERSTYDSLLANIDRLSSLSPILYRINPDGSLGRLNVLNRAEVLALARQKTIAVMPVVGDDFDFERVSLLLSDETVSEKFIKQLVDEAKRENFAGWDIDIESLRRDDKEAFTRFIGRARASLHQNNLQLNVVVFARTQTSDNDAARAQDYKALAEAADEVRIMMYGAHDEDTGPGGQAPLSFIREALGYAVSLVPREKIVVGLSTHGYDFAGESAEPLTYQQIEKRIGEATASVRLDEKVSSAVFRYQKDGENHEIWFESAPAIIQKIEMILNEFDIDKFALWRIGAEDPNLWDKLTPPR